MAAVTDICRVAVSELFVYADHINHFRTDCKRSKIA
jgi:hypothetical protein